MPKEGARVGAPRYAKEIVGLVPLMLMDVDNSAMCDIVLRASFKSRACEAVMSVHSGLSLLAAASAASRLSGNTTAAAR